MTEPDTCSFCDERKRDLSVYRWRWGLEAVCADCLADGEEAS